MKLLKRLFRKKTNNETNQSLPKIDFHMEYIYEAISNHLKMKTSGALLLTGEWGSGKTYYIKNHVFPRLEKETEFIPLIVSLYGITDKNEIARMVFFEYFDRKGKHSTFSIASITKYIEKLLGTFPCLNKHVDLEKLITGTGDSLFRFLPHNKLLICFDDLERVSDQINTIDILGLINNLVENKGYKILIIANNDEIKEISAFKEKTIEKTIHFTPNISAIIDSIINSYSDDSFKKYLHDNKEFLLKTLNPKTEDENDAKYLKKSFSNIRTIKFAIEHFKYPFEILNKKKDITDELTQTQLRSIWLFVLSVSTEFRKSNITFDNRADLDNQTFSLYDLGSNGFSLGSDQNKEDERDVPYSEKYKRKYYKRLSEKYIYHPDIYDLITVSNTISEDSFLNNIEESFNVKEGKINPAHKLLNRFMYDIWTFKDKEFKDSLEKLLSYVEKGELLDIISYLNAGDHLLNLSDMFNQKKEVILEKLEKGIEIFFSNNPKINMLTINHLNMASNSIKEENIQKLILFIQEKISDIKNKEIIEEINKLSNLIKEDTSKFVKEFFPEEITISHTEPILHKLHEDKVIDAVVSWNGEAIKNICLLLQRRYLDKGPSNLAEELIFLECLEKGINERETEEKTLSNYLIKKELKPLISICKKNLKKDKNARQK